MKTTILLAFLNLFVFGNINFAFSNAIEKPCNEQKFLGESLKKRKPQNRFWEYLAFIFIFPFALAFLLTPSFIIGSISALVFCTIFGFSYSSSIFWIITVCVGLLYFFLQLNRNYRKSTVKKNKYKKRSRLFSIKPFRS